MLWLPVLIFPILIVLMHVPLIIGYVPMFSITILQAIVCVTLPIFAGILAFSLTTMKSPVDSLLALISVFIYSIIIFITIGMEFLAFTFLIVYIGAISILFLFIVILFNLTETFTVNNLTLVNFAVASLACIVVSKVLTSIKVLGLDFVNVDNAQIVQLYEKANLLFPEIHVITNTFYNVYWDFFILCGGNLLVAMFGAIALALSEDK